MKPAYEPGMISYGDFGPAHEEVQKAYGSIKNYNVEITFLNGLMKIKGILSEDCKLIYAWGKLCFLAKSIA